MRYFFHVLTDKERRRDDEGAEFPSLAAARGEASQTARDLMAEELRCGRPAPVSWRIQIAADDGTILLTLPFLRIALPPATGPIVPGEVLLDPALVARTKGTIQEVRRSHDEMAKSIGEIHCSLRQLDRMGTQGA